MHDCHVFSHPLPPLYAQAEAARATGRAAGAFFLVAFVPEHAVVVRDLLPDGDARFRDQF